MQVLSVTEPERWGNLWLSSLFKQHMIVSLGDLFFYVLLVAPKALLLVQLVVEDNGDLWLDPSPDRFLVAAPRTIHEFTCHEYSMSLVRGVTP
eukprot:1450643-Pyramimonas_sp.AAC.1